MADQSVRGRFIWHELMTPDCPGARTFYTQTLGWRSVGAEHAADYSMFAADRGPLAGVGPLDGVPRWVPFVGVPDVDETARQAEERGAQIERPPTDIPSGGRYALLRDPQDAAFGIYSPPGEPPPEHAPEPGEFVWHELAAQDWRTAFEFYAGLFGWERMDEHDMGPMGVYLLFGRDGIQLGGMFDKRDGGLPGGAYWLGYVFVENVREAAAKVEAAGGRIAVGPMQVPGGGWIAQCLDPAGALFAVHMAGAEMPEAEAADPAQASAEPAAEAVEPESRAALEPPAGRKAAVEKKRGARKKGPAAAKKKVSKKQAGEQKVSKKKTSKKKTSKKKAAPAKVAKKKVGKRKASKKKISNKQAGKKISKRKVSKKKVAAAKKRPSARAGTKKAAKKANKKQSAKAGARKKAAGGKKKPKRVSKKAAQAAGTKKTTKRSAKRPAKKAAATQSGGNKSGRKKTTAKSAPAHKTTGRRKAGKSRSARRRNR